MIITERLASQIDEPNFDYDGTWVHDWQRYVGANLRPIWFTIPREVRAAIVLDLQEIADREDWE